MDCYATLVCDRQWAGDHPKSREEPMTDGASDSVCKASSVEGGCHGRECLVLLCSSHREAGQPCDEGWIKVV